MEVKAEPQQVDEKFPWDRAVVNINEPFIMILQRGELKFDVAKVDGIQGNKFGTFAHSEIINQPFGTLWVSKTGKQRQHRRKKQKTTSEVGEDTKNVASKGKLNVLSCTPELWCRSLLHRTQIIYSSDASLICFHLDLLPGKIVIESGTGSGSLTMALARSVAPTGFVHTYEFNESRVQAAIKDFNLLGISNLIKIKQGDAASEEGFVGSEGKADAMFLDLPKPWLAIKNCVAALRKDVETRLCSFSPCIEQVQKTCIALKDHGFFQIRTFECVNREFETYRLQEKIPSMWEHLQSSSELKTSFTPSNKIGATCVYPEMATHTGYLTFCSRFPLLNESKMTE